MQGVQGAALGAPAGLCSGRVPPAAGGAAHLGGAHIWAGRPGSDSGGAGAEHPTAGASGTPSPAETMPKCPRCDKEVYFGKGFLPPPRPRGWDAPVPRCRTPLGFGTPAHPSAAAPRDTLATPWR